VFVKATVNYSVSPSTIQNLYRTVGPNWFDTLVESRVLNFFKERNRQVQSRGYPSEP
jgi:hypothetical protein